MADQKLVAIPDVSFLVVQLSYYTKSSGAFCLFFLDSMDLWHYQSNYSKNRSLQILLCSLLQAKHLVITQEKTMG